MILNNHGLIGFCLMICSFKCNFCYATDLFKSSVLFVNGSNALRGSKKSSHTISFKKSDFFITLPFSSPMDQFRSHCWIIKYLSTQGFLKICLMDLEYIIVLWFTMWMEYLDKMKYLWLQSIRMLLSYLDAIDGEKIMKYLGTFHSIFYLIIKKYFFPLNIYDETLQVAWPNSIIHKKVFSKQSI